jgi:hypothetical protein
VARLRAGLSPKDITPHTLRHTCATLLLQQGTVFLGSAMWWFVLSGAVGLFRAKLSARGLRWANRASGTIITTFGVLAVSGLG